MDAARSVVSTNDVILNRSCRDMGVGASYQPYGRDCLVHRGRVIKVSSKCLQFPSYRLGIVSRDRASMHRVSSHRYEESKVEILVLVPSYNLSRVDRFSKVYEQFYDTVQMNFIYPSNPTKSMIFLNIYTMVRMEQQGGHGDDIKQPLGAFATHIVHFYNICKGQIQRQDYITTISSVHRFIEYVPSKPPDPRNLLTDSKPGPPLCEGNRER
uniref:Uncharacterized protein n=1 Tax=Cucumis melo TaxID=3656 RepID=A0A9I9ED07_CUCME